MHEDTVLYLQFDGDNNSTTITDDCGHTVSVNGDTCLKTATKKVGTASGYFPGNGYLELADSADWDLADGNFTIHGWLYNTAEYSAWCDLAGQWTAGSDVSWLIAWDTDRKPLFVYSKSGSDQYYSTSSTAMSLNAWCHLAFVRNGTTIKTYMDGTEVASLSCGTDIIYNSSRVLRIGCRSSVANYFFTGYLDNFIIIKGTALWTASFTPPVPVIVSAAIFNATGSLRIANYILDIIVSNPIFTAGTVIVGDKGYGFRLSDSATSSSSIISGLLTLINNPVFSSSASLSADKVLGMIATDEMFAYDYSAGGWLKKITETYEFHDLILYSGITTFISDYIIVQATETNKHRANGVCVDTILIDTATTVKYIIKLAADIMANSDTITGHPGRILEEIISYAEGLSQNLAITTTATENLDTADLIAWAWFIQASDTFATTEAVTTIPLMYALASENLTIAESISHINTISFALADASTIAETVSAKGIFKNIIQESLGFIIRITLDDETYQCWVLNTNELYPSCYGNFAFNSYAELEGTTYAARDTGIFKLTGTTDNGTAIETGLRLNIFNTGIQKGKRFDNARFGISGTNLALKVTTENDSIQYYILSGRCKIARGQHGREWVFELAKADHIDFIELYPAILSR